MKRYQKILLVLIALLIVGFAIMCGALVLSGTVPLKLPGSNSHTANSSYTPENAVSNIDTHTSNAEELNKLENYRGDEDGIGDAAEEILVNPEGGEIARTTYTPNFFASPTAKPSDDDSYLAVIGDSFSAGTFDYDYWPKILANTMDYTGVVDEAIVGSGFVEGGSAGEGLDFSRQLGVLIDSPYFSHVDDIIVYGGTNDFVQGHVPAGEMESAIDDFMDLYYSIPSGKRPVLHLCIGNMGYAQSGLYDDLGDGSGTGYLSWLSEIQQYCRESGYPLVDNVVYFHMNQPNMFSNDLLHPSAKGQQVIASYMTSILSGHYAGVHVVQKFEGLSGSAGSCLTSNVVNFDNGETTVTVRFEEDVKVQGIGSGDSYTDLGNFSNGTAMYSVMIGRDSAKASACVYGTILGSSANDHGYIGAGRLMCDMSNNHVYLNVLGAADAFPNKTFTIKAGTQATFTTFATS